MVRHGRNPLEIPPEVIIIIFYLHFVTSCWIICEWREDRGVEQTWDMYLEYFKYICISWNNFFMCDYNLKRNQSIFADMDISAAL